MIIFADKYFLLAYCGYVVVLIDGIGSPNRGSKNFF